MKLYVKENREVLADDNYFGTQNENKSTILELDFEDSINDFIDKRIVFITQNGIFQDVLSVDNTYELKNSITKYEELKAYIWLLRDDGTDFRTQEFELNLYSNQKASTDVPTEEELDMFHNLITTVNLEIQKVENLNISVERLNDCVEVTITKKDGSIEKVKIEDGKNYEITEEDYKEIISRIDIPRRTSDLENDSNFVSDDKYVHIDNNFTDEEKAKLEGLQNYNDTEIKEEINTIKNNQQTDESNITSLDKELKGLKSNVEGINDKIPVQATKDNKLADKDFVNSSIATSTATFQGTFSSLEELQKVTADINDYANVITIENDNTFYNRYTHDGKNWIFNFKINTTTFTAEQWKAINSGITEDLVDKLIGIDLSNYIKNTDYASSSKGGVIKIGTYGSDISAEGILKANIYSKESYPFAKDNSFIGKKTLENVIELKELVNKTYVDSVVGDIENLLNTIEEKRY